MSLLQGRPGMLSLALTRLPSLSPSLWLAALAVVAIASLLPGMWTLAGLIGLSGLLLLVAKPEVAVYLLTLSVPLGSLLEINLGTLSVTPTEGLVALLAVGWAARALARRRLILPTTPLLVPLAAMLFVVALSTYQATEVSLALKETLKWLELVLVFLFIVAEMSTAPRVMLLVSMLLLGAVVEALIGSAQFVLGLGPGTFAIGPFMRAYGTFEQPNPYAGYLGMLIPLAVGLLLTRPIPRLRRPILAACLLTTAAVLMSLSRGAWVGIALGVAVMMLFWSSRSRILLAAGTLATVPLAALAFLNLLPEELAARLATAADYFRFVDARQEVVTSQNWAVIERVAHWQAALDMIAARPLFGVGAGNYSAAYDTYYVPGWLEALGHAHNYYLNIAAETGIPGLLIYLTIPAVALLHAMKWLRRTEAKTGTQHSALSTQHPGSSAAWTDRLLWRGVLAGVLGSLVASSMHNLFDSLFVHSMSVQLGMILALGQVSAQALSSETTTRSRGDEESRRGSPRLLAPEPPRPHGSQNS